MHVRSFQLGDTSSVKTLLQDVLSETCYEETIEYYRIAVATEYQRKGIGKALIEAMKQRFLQRNVKKIMVTVDVHNEIVLPVYESAGYSTSDFSRTAHRLSIVKKVSV